MRDVVLAEASRAAQDQRLQRRGVEAAVHVRLVGHDLLEALRILQREPERLLEVRVDVAERR